MATTEAALAGQGKRRVTATAQAAPMTAPVVVEMALANRAADTGTMEMVLADQVAGMVMMEMDPATRAIHRPQKDHRASPARGTRLDMRHPF
jgi:hypothetical protein